jgi:hypothetical protein
MPFVAMTAKANSVGFDPGFFFSPPSTSQSSAKFGDHEVGIPGGVEVLVGRPSFCMYQGDAASRLYIVGAHTDNLVFTENYNLYRQGIPPPRNPFVAGAGSGMSIGVAATAAVGSGRKGACVCYIRWYDERHVRRSPLSGASPEITMTDQALAWTNLPVYCDEDPSVTHVELWASMDGNVPRLVVRRDLGAVNVTEEIPTLQLGEAYAEDYRRFPRCRYNVAWHDRQVMSGDDKHPDRIYFSLLDDFENYGDFYVKTRKGDKVTGLYCVRDNLFVGTATTTYVITGYTEDDIKIDVFEPDIGLISHHGVGNFDDYAVIPTQRGFYVNSGGAMHYSSRGHEELWRSEYKLHQAEYENGWCVIDINDDVYKFCIGQPSPGSDGSGSTIPAPVYGYLDAAVNHGWEELDTGPLATETTYWVLDMNSIGKGETLLGGPQLMFDVRARRDTCAASIALPGSSRADVIVGSDDGHIRIEGVEDAEDDGDPLYKFSAIVTKHYDWILDGQGDDGWSMPYVWSYAESSTEDAGDPGNYHFYVIGGNGHEFPYDRTLASYIPTYPFASEQFIVGWTGPLGVAGLSDKWQNSYWVYTPSTRNMMTPKNLSGQGFTFMVTAFGSGQIFWRGVSGKLHPCGNAGPSTVNVTFVE